MGTKRSVSIVDDDAIAILDGLDGISVSRYVTAAVKRVHALDLTEDSVYHLRQLREHAGDMDDPYDTASKLLGQASGEAAMAVALLRGAGWMGNEILAVMQSSMEPMRLPIQRRHQELALEMHDAAQLGRVDRKQWGITPERWSELSARLHTGQHLEESQALLDVDRLVTAASGTRLEAALYRDVPTGSGAQVGGGL